MPKSAVSLSAIAVLAFAFVPSTPTLAQVPELSAEQLEQLQQLPQDQQQQMLELFQQQSDADLEEDIDEPAPISPRDVGDDAMTEDGMAGGEEEAEEEEEAEPAIGLGILGLASPPQPRSIDQRLEQFGYDLFAGAPDTFAPADFIPVPSDYVIGPGDSIVVRYFGGDIPGEEVQVTREGVLNLTDLAPLPVAGMSFEDVRDLIEQRVAEQLVGVEVSVTTGELRSIQVLVAGDVFRSGQFTVSGLSTMTNALFVSGGVRPIGSLRNVELRRNNELIQTLDLYDLLLNGFSADDARLQPRDVIFIPPIGPTVAVAGEVRRPAIYELKGGETAADVLAMAGGLANRAYPQASQLERINEARIRTLLDVDLTTAAALETPMRDGDVLRVYSVLERLQDIVLVRGHVQRPGGQQWRPGMRLTDVIRSVDDLRARADVNYALIRRELSPAGDIDVFSVSLAEALTNPASAANVPLEPRDQILVFNLEGNRTDQVNALLEELRLQSSFDNAVRVASIRGQVRAQGNYPLETGMRISDLVRAGGGFTESAYINEAELARYEIVNGEERQTEVIAVDLQAVLRGDPAADLVLQPYDQLTVRQISQWRNRPSVSLTGEITFPGQYSILPGETLSSVLRRAGGLTSLASPEGSIFLRRELVNREREQLDTLAGRMQADLATMLLSVPEFAEAFPVGLTLVRQLQETEPTGRMVIDLEAIMNGEATADFVLQAGDRLLVPEAAQSVTVMGEVQYSASHLFAPGLDREDYINRSGGFSARADDDRVYVVRVDGSVAIDGGSRWFNRRPDLDIQPGDTIVVPLDTDRFRRLQLWTNVTEILYNMAIAVAAVNSF